MKKILTLIIALFLIPSSAFAAIAFNNSAVGTNATCTNTNTIANYVVTGSNTLIVVEAYVANTTAASVSWGATSLTLATSTQQTNQVSIWYAAVGSGGTNTITLTDTAGSQKCQLVAESFTGVNQTNPLDVVAAKNCSGTCANPTLSVTTATANEWAVDALTRQSGEKQAVPLAGQTSVASSTWSTGTVGYNASYAGPFASAGSNSMGYTMLTANYSYATAFFCAVGSCGGRGGGSSFISGLFEFAGWLWKI